MSFSTASLKKIEEEMSEHENILKKLLEMHEEECYLKAGTKILCKTANEVVENRPSRRIRLRKNMSILL